MTRATQRISRAAVAAFTTVAIPAATAIPTAIAVFGQPAAGSAASATTHRLPSYDTWIADVTEVLDEADEFLQRRTAQSDGDGKLAIVMDIDNTALESSYSSGRVTPAIPPSLRTALAAAADDVAIFFVTARPESYRKTTDHNLTAVGYRSTGLHLRPNGDTSSVQRYKTNARIAIERRGYTIVANIGNNTHDLAGGHAERTFKLPDYGGLLP